MAARVEPVNDQLNNNQDQRNNQKELFWLEAILFLPWNMHENNGNSDSLIAKMDWLIFQAGNWFNDSRSASITAAVPQEFSRACWIFISSNDLSLRGLELMWSLSGSVVTRAATKSCLEIALNFEQASKHGKIQQFLSCSWLPSINTTNLHTKGRSQRELAKPQAIHS